MQYFTVAIETFNGTEQHLLGITEDGRKLGIPTDPANTDYEAYLAWLEEGNEPEPYNPESEPPLA
jgi:hypothetical protein